MKTARLGTVGFACVAWMSMARRLLILRQNGEATTFLIALGIETRG